MQVLMPESLAEAVALKSMYADAVPIAGATDVFVRWPENLAGRDRTYLDLSALTALRRVTIGEDTVEIGALTTYWDVRDDAALAREFPLLPEAARQIGAVQVQARGTWAGNVANASPAADGVAVLMAYDAEVELVSATGSRWVPLAGFYHGYKVLEARDEELIRAIRLPRREYALEYFEKVVPRRAQAITKVGAAVTCSDAGWRVVAISVAPTVCRCTAVEILLEQARPVRGPDDLLDALRRDISPIDDVRSTARYRERVLSRILWFALRDACPSFE